MKTTSQHAENGLVTGIGSMPPVVSEVAPRIEENRFFAREGVPLFHMPLQEKLPYIPDWEAVW